VEHIVSRLRDLADRIYLIIVFRVITGLLLHHCVHTPHAVML
jgi:hypothetical protein